MCCEALFASPDDEKRWDPVLGCPLTDGRVGHRVETREGDASGVVKVAVGDECVADRAREALAPARVNG
jgi:hypothetical protein